MVGTFSTTEYTMSRAFFSSDLASQRREVCPGHSPVVSSQRGNVASVTISCADSTFCQAFHFDVQIGLSSCRHLGFFVPLVLFLPLLLLACDKVLVLVLVFLYFRPSFQ